MMTVVSGCGVESSQYPRHRVLTTTYSDTPFALIKDFNRCANEEAYLHDGKIIHSVLFAEESQILDTHAGERQRFLKKPQIVFLCPEEDSYKDNSVESSALQITKTIQKTFLFFTRVAPQLRISPVKVNLTPLIFRRGSYLTDNASYRPSSSTITFLPHSLQHRHMSYSRNLWNVPMVAAHEYGHHLFENLPGGKLLPSDHQSSCFGNEESPEPSLKSFRSFSTKEVLTAFNEAFSDLVAFYSLSPSENNLDSVRCLEVSRDVESPRFYDGNPKIFDEAALRLFFSSTRYLQLSCEQTSYQDVHTMGAIVAYSYNKFSGELTNSREEKLAALIEWVKFLKFEHRHRSHRNPEQFLRESFGELLRISAARLNRSFDENLCRLVDEIFPDLNLKECSNRL